MPNDVGFDLIRHSATPASADLWSPHFKVRAERHLWVAVMQAQMALGVEAVHEHAVLAYQHTIDHVDLDRIRQRELILHHDVKARLEEFNYLAGHQLAHLGMTGRDLDDNVELYQQRLALEELADELRDRHQDATSNDVRRLARRVRFRGVVGAVGTGQDQLDLLGGSHRKLAQLNERVSSHLGFSPYVRLDSVGQVYPRSLDFEIASSLTATLSATSRLDRAPSPWLVLMRGFCGMIAELAGDQWHEGDVSCSSVRRVALPGLFLAASAHVRLL